MQLADAGKVSEPSQSRLLAIITGMEHSGTTFLSNLLIANAPEVNAGFECGILLSKNSPADFKNVHPFFEWMCYSTDRGQWALTPEQREEVCSVKSWDEFYMKLINYSPLFQKHEKWTIDKTPKYAYHIKTIRDRAPSTPIVVTTKDIRLLYHSYKKRGFNISNFSERFLAYAKSMSQIQENDPQFYYVSHEQLCTNTLRTLRSVCRHLGLQEPDRLETNLRWTAYPVLNPDFNYKTSINNAVSQISDQEHRALQALSVKHPTQASTGRIP